MSTDIPEKPTNMDEPEIPSSTSGTTTEEQTYSKFKTLIKDFISDLSITYPEYCHTVSEWAQEDISNEKVKELFEYCKKLYPERFFDILYQDEDIFKDDSDVNVYFLPKLSFRLLFNEEGVSDNTKKTIWKYLQLILFTVVGDVNNMSDFGDATNLFNGIDEKDLQQKITETLENISGLFNDKQETSTEGGNETPNMPDYFTNMFDNIGGEGNEMPTGGIPQFQNFQEHLKKIFDGKIGALAKEMTQEIAGELKDIFGENLDNVENPKDILKNVMKNPNKLSKLMKSVKSKLESKMASGEISREDIMKEAGDMVNSMKEMGGTEQMKSMFENAAKSMGLGKNAKFNKAAFERMAKREEAKTKIKERADIRRQKVAEDKRAEFEKFKKQQQAEFERQKAFTLRTQGNNSENLIFKLEGADEQEKTKIRKEITKAMDDEIIKEFETGTTEKVSSTKKKNKKKKKT